MTNTDLLLAGWTTEQILRKRIEEAETGGEESLRQLMIAIAWSLMKAL